MFVETGMLVDTKKTTLCVVGVAVGSSMVGGCQGIKWLNQTAQNVSYEEINAVSVLLYRSIIPLLVTFGTNYLGKPFVNV